MIRRFHVQFEQEHTRRDISRKPVRISQRVAPGATQLKKKKELVLRRCEYPKGLDLIKVQAILLF